MFSVSLSKTLLRQRHLGGVLVRGCHSQKNDNISRVRTYFNKVIDNPLPVGAGALVVGLLQWKRIRDREARKANQVPELEEAAVAEPWQVSAYTNLPLRHASRLWGWANDIHLPEWSRSFLLGLYVNTFDCNMEEAEKEDLESYQNLGELFRRRLRPGAREICSLCPLVSPCDGKVLHWGEVEAGGRVEQVKGVSYLLENFLGPGLPSLENKKLYQCVLYLAPGDYHCFHSPASWTIKTRRHFPGELLSVNPGVVKWIESLFCLNERVAYIGEWEHGFFSMTAVGATNVGSVVVEMDPELRTNTRDWERETFHQKVWPGEGVSVNKGEYFGEFNLGSTIILIFEAPEDFKFSFHREGERVKVGGALEPITVPPINQHLLHTASPTPVPPSIDQNLIYTPDPAPSSADIPQPEAPSSDSAPARSTSSAPPQSPTSTPSQCG